MAQRVKTARFHFLPLILVMGAGVFFTRLGGAWEAVNALPERLPEQGLKIEKVTAEAQEKKPPAMSSPENGQEKAGPKAPMRTPGPYFAEEVPFSQAELDILQNLAERREELEKREKELDQRVAMLTAAENQIDRKILRLKELQQSIQDLMGQYEEKKSKNLDSLVDIYGKMKPKDAARIFNELDMPILLTVFRMMKERKSAAILAEMDSERAKNLTAQLARGDSFPLSGVEEVPAFEP